MYNKILKYYPSQKHSPLAYFYIPFYMSIQLVDYGFNLDNILGLYYYIIQCNHFKTQIF